MFYMPTMPTVDEPGKKVLRVIQRSGVATGWQVMSETAMTDAEVSDAATKLVSMGLISANANTINPKEIGQVYFNIQPSASRVADIVLSNTQS